MSGEDDGDGEGIEDEVTSPAAPVAEAAAGTTVAPDDLEHFVLVLVDTADVEVATSGSTEGLIEVSSSRTPDGASVDAVNIELVPAKRKGAVVVGFAAALRRAECVDD